ncbi:MAG: GMC family oxidoreductase N-terminal domain-containing protein [Thermoplasmata archaeon]
MGASDTLRALVDTLLPASPADEQGPGYPAATSVGLDRDIAEIVTDLSKGEQADFARLLSALDSRFANLVLTGRPVQLHRLDAAARERYLLGWATSRLAVKRKGFHAMKRLAAGQYFSGPLAGTPNPLWNRIHYGPPSVPSGLPDPLDGLSPVRPDRDVEEEVDACVIGSGAGGGVIAERLVRAGYSTVVLEAGAWFTHRSYPRVERDAQRQLFAGGGLLTTRNGAIGILAGATVGGGTAINWMTCLSPRPEARAEWARDGGMEGIDGADFDRHLQAVAERLHVSTAESQINANNDSLRRGCIALGFRQGIDWDVIPRNAVGCQERCGFCSFGCPYAARQSGPVTFLLDALRGGARLYSSTRADFVEVEQGRVTGVRATFREGSLTRNVHVRARTTVVAAGALQTPALLLRSGIRHAGVGAGLRLDPTTALAGEFPAPVRTWVGPPQTIGVYRFQTCDAGAHGPWMEVAPAHPGLSAIALPWAGARDFHRLLGRSEYVASPIVLVRDVGEGRVTIDTEGRPRFDYVLTPRDRQNLLRGMVETARLLHAGGATRLLSLQTSYAEVGDGRRPLSEGELDRFIAQVEHVGVRDNAIALFSAHPIGSARAGRDPRTSATRPSGEVHGVEGLWIGDGSLLPSAPGANPMMSILAVAQRTADHLLAKLRAI